MAAKPPFSRSAIVCIVRDLLAAELSLSRGRSTLDLGADRWDAATRVDVDGLDLDSLERLNAAAALNEYFHLHEHGAEDHLLALPRIGDWCDLVEQSLDAAGTHLTFRTSGSTGDPKRCTHAIADLMVEVDAWANMFAGVDRIVSLVPAHHIYGTVFTALLPDRLGVACTPVRALPRASAPMRALPHDHAPGMLVVATPTIWAYLSRSALAFAPGTIGVSSTAPLSAQLANQLAGQRLERLVEVYGSSETGGVATRETPAAPFALLDHWTRAGDGALARPGADGAAIACALPDAACWLDDRRFALDGRRDGAVQVGGVNVFPQAVRDRLLGHVGVADAAVRLEAVTGRLKAFVVPVAGTDGAALADALDAWCGRELPTVERPRRFATGAALPRNALGKLSDW